MSFMSIASSALIVRVIIKVILLSAPSRNISLIENNTQRSIKSFVITKASQSVYLWARWVYNVKKPLFIFTKCLQEQNSY